MLRKRANHRVWIALWAVSVSILIMGVTARHMAPFRQPSGLEQAAKGLLDADAQGRSSEKVVAAHILDPRCSCSETVLSVLQKKTDPKVKHFVLSLSALQPTTRAGLESAGVRVLETTPEKAKAEFQIESVPWLVVIGNGDQTLYSGGYSKTQIRTEGDLGLEEILRTAKEGRALASLPSYSCATSQKLRKLLLQDLGQE